MFGSIVGDIIGSPYEGMSKVPTDFPLFFDTPFRYPPRPSKYTDDSILTCATAEAILDHGNPTAEQYAPAYIKWFEMYADRSFWGHGFQEWAEAGLLTVRSGPTNGAAMRVAPIGWAFDNVEAVREAAQQSCHFTHNDPIAIKSAVAVAEAVFLARTGSGQGCHQGSGREGFWRRPSRRTAFDLSSNTRMLIDSGGKPTAEMVYDAFGVERHVAGDATTPFRFGGGVGYWSDENDQMYVRA